jgi:hypothetical protein
MAPVGGEEVGTGDMQPMPRVAHPHAGFIDMENLCILQEVSGMFFNSGQVSRALARDCNHSCLAQRVTKEVKNHLRGSFIGKQLVDAELDQERLQVDAILHGVRYLDRKFSWVKTPTMGAPFVFCTVFSHDNPGRRYVKNLTSFYDRWVDMFQGCPAPGTGGSSMDDDHIRVLNRLKGMTFVTLLTTRRAFTLLP